VPGATDFAVMFGSFAALSRGVSRAIAFGVSAPAAGTVAVRDGPDPGVAHDRALIGRTALGRNVFALSPAGRP